MQADIILQEPTIGAPLGGHLWWGPGGSAPLHMRLHSVLINDFNAVQVLTQCLSCRDVIQTCHKPLT